MEIVEEVCIVIVELTHNEPGGGSDRLTHASIVPLPGVLVRVSSNAVGSGGRLPAPQRADGRHLESYTVWTSQRFEQAATSAMKSQPGTSGRMDNIDLAFSLDLAHLEPGPLSR